MPHSLDVVLAPGIFPPDSGGPATFAASLGEALTRRGHRVHVLTNGSAPAGFDERYPFEVVRIPRGDSVPRRYTRQFRMITRELRRRRPDVVLTNAFDLQVVPMARFLGIPVATKVVGDEAWERAQRGGLATDIASFQRQSHGPRVEFFKFLRSCQTRLADRVVVPSEYLRDVVTGWGVRRECTRVIYNAVDIDIPETPIEDRTRRITTVGRLVPWKGVESLIEAVSESDLNEVELHVVGDGPERDRLDTLADGVDATVEFHGGVPHERVLDTVRHSMVFALNSTYEGLPHVVLEAMACGTPTVASAAGGTPEVIADERSGLLVPQGDTEELATAFERLLTDRVLWSRLQHGGYGRIERQFGHERIIDEYEAFLHKLASGR